MTKAINILSENTLILVLIVLLGSMAVPVAAQHKQGSDPVTTIKSFSMEDIMLINNPFVSQLPKKEVAPPPEPVEVKKPVVQKKAPVVKKHPVTTTPGPRPVEQPTPPPSAIEQEVSIPVPEMNLTGLIWNTDKPQAIINDQIVSPGDKFLGGVEIVNIDSEGVSVKFLGKTIRLKSD